MKSRREAREVVLKTLYRVEATGNTAEEAYNDVCMNWSRSPFDEVYAQRLLKGITTNVEGIDAILRDIVKNWDIERIAIIDRNILRIAICEVVYFDDIPPKVSMDEAIEIAKIYSTSDSGKFVNGILDKVVKREKQRKQKRTMDL
ncbi:MAG: transcription antitermination factor NusB [bacterium (Candidatus Stahlbacteria) CG08_land_8_20_14_0_20_40_26]|nr:MAG: transcription antitermination factor NusB [bacterium (Candidatus Stahlbacteria) CG23_combo_of_CG06-09_8_20_14_all_40_9]PIS24841.1 MAG: transcription antitermination factor NusB [bacterium (Candidatus Stahlbacteria) CG08_land_8_20_14_0_20_40_26]